MHMEAIEWGSLSFANTENKFIQVNVIRSFAVLINFTRLSICTYNLLLLLFEWMLISFNSVAWLSISFVCVVILTIKQFYSQYTTYLLFSYIHLLFNYWVQPINLKAFHFLNVFLIHFNHLHLSCFNIKNIYPHFCFN